MPLVSVIIPNYNHSMFLKQRIESVLNQTFQDFELIILDDSSTDNSEEIIDQYCEHEKISHIVYNNKNSGSTFKQWNKGAALAKGNYIWIAESDDIADKTFLESLIKKIEDNPSVNIVFCQSYKMSASGEINGTWKEWTKDIDRNKLFESDFFLDGKFFIHDFLLYKNVLLNASAVLFRKKAFEIVGGVDEDIKYCSDWLLWLKILTIGSVSFNAIPLNYFRYHEKSVIAQAVSHNKLNLPYDIRMRRRFNRFLIKMDIKPFSIRTLNAKFLSSEANIVANYLLSIKQVFKAFYFFRIVIWYSVSPEKRKYIGLFAHNFFKMFGISNIQSSLLK